jgi:predicted N-formylglutamate amidohydrolase
VTARSTACSRPGACLHLLVAQLRSRPRSRANRQFDLGVLYDPDHAFEAALAEVLLAGLAAAGFAVRANQPYGGVGPALCTSLRAGRRDRRYAGIELETSYAVARADGGTARVAAALAPLVAAALTRR